MTDLMTQGRAVYRCPCGFTVVDDRAFDDDELAFDLAIDDHEAHCVEYAEQRAWEASAAPVVRQVPALIAEQLADEHAERASTEALAALFHQMAKLGRSATSETEQRHAAQEEGNRQARAELDDVIYPGFRRLLLALLVGTVVLTGMILAGQAWPVVLVGALAGVVLGGAGEWAIARMRGR